MVLQGDIALQRTILHGALVLLDTVNHFAVELDLDALTFAGQNHLLPFTGRLGHVFACTLRSDDAAMVVVSHFVVGLAEAVQNLNLDALGDRIDRIPVVAGVGDAEVQAGVALLWQLVLHREDEVLVLLLGVEVRLVSLPAALALAGLDGKGAIFLRHPVALGLPACQVLAIEEFDKAVLTCLALSTFAGASSGAGRQGGQEEQSDQEAVEHGGPSGLMNVKQHAITRAAKNDRA